MHVSGLTSLDIARAPAGVVNVSESVMISANASDLESGVENMTLQYSANNATSWLVKPMTFNTTTCLYQAVIPSQQAGSKVKYTLVAFDGADNNAKASSKYLIAEEVTAKKVIVKEVWAPSTQGAVTAATVTVGAAAVASSLASAAGSSVSQSGSKLGERLGSILPNTAKKWLFDSVSSRFKIEVQERVGSPFLLTKVEAASYAVTLTVLTLGLHMPSRNRYLRCWSRLSWCW